MSNILVLGSNGMTGHTIAKFLTDQQYNVKTLARTNADFNIDVEKEDLSFLNTFDFDYVINCIGLLISDSEQFPDKAVYLNSYLPHYL